MTETKAGLRAFAEIGLANLSERMVSDSARIRISSQAKRFPTAHWCGFEIRLGDNQDQVDFHYAIKREDAGLAAALDCFASAAQRHWFQRFRARWQDPASSYFKGIEYLVFEHDLLDSSPPDPALFIAFTDELNASERYTLACEIVSDAFAAPPSLIASLERVFSSTASPEKVTHIGLMLSREPTVVRLNIGGMLYSHLPDRLRAMGYRQSASHVLNKFTVYSRFVEKVTVCLDISDEILPRIGLECFLTKQPPGDSRYQLFLGQLASNNLCDEKKIDDLLAWPGRVTPLHQINDWPESLLVKSLTQPPDVFGVIDQSISHIKLDIYPDGHAAAKAYLSMEHRYHAVTTEGVNVNHMIDEGGSTPQVLLKPLADAIQNGVVFLSAARHQSGWWRDYCGLFDFHGSDEYLSAYIGYILTTLGDNLATSLARDIWALLAQCHRPAGGWGWHPWAACDADSTSWGLQLATALAVGASDTEKANAFLVLHRHLDGGVATYEENHCRTFYANGSGVASDLNAWCQPHVCVTAGAIHVAEVREAGLRYLREQQQEDGCWKGYWWPDDEFVTALAVRAFATYGNDGDKGCIEAAVTWALKRINQDQGVYSKSLGKESAFASASCLEILIHGSQTCCHPDVGDAVEQLAMRLLSTQLADGSWTPSASLYWDPEAIPLRTALDHNGLTTTATVLHALGLYQLLVSGA